MSEQTAPPETGLQDLPFIKALPDYAEPFVVRGIELLALLLSFLVLRWLVTRLVNRAVRAVVAREEAAGDPGRAARVRTLAGLVRSVLFYALLFAFVVAALGTLDVETTGLLGTAGVVGLAIGFGAQKLVKDVTTGFFLLLEDQYAVGDYVTIGGVTGTVEELGMRITRIRDDDGRLYILSNGDIAQVCNQSRGPVGGTLEVAIAAAADTEKAARALDAAFARASQEMDLAEPARVAGIAAADAAKTVLRVHFRARATQRPGDVALRLRETARDSLQAAEIPLA